MNELADITERTHHTFPPLGECIYCGSKEQLQDEHIIAYSLNGNAILPKASCRKHADITSQFEGDFARGPALPMRALFGFKSHHGRKTYPASFQLRMKIDGNWRSVDLPLPEFPVILQLPVFAFPPSFLTGQRDIPANSERTILICLRENKSPREILHEVGRRFHAEEIEVPRVDHKVFARLIAKSAYCLAVAQFGIAGIKQKYVLPGILGEADDLGTWIGSSEQPLAGEEAQHITQVKTYYKPGGEEIIVVLLKLFGTLPAPGYLVVVGSKHHNP